MKHGFDIGKYILANTKNLSGSQRHALLSLRDEFDLVRNMRSRAMVNVRDRLNELRQEKYLSPHRPLIEHVTAVVKRIYADKYGDEDVVDTHFVTDHAFCAGARRIGMDMDGFKDILHQEAVGHGLRPLKSKKGYIVTYLPALKKEGVMA